MSCKRVLFRGEDAGSLLALLVFILVAACQAPDPSAGKIAGPQDAPTGQFRQQHWLIPFSEADTVMAATVWRPEGAPPYPLAIIAHASSEDPQSRMEDPTPRYEILTKWFLQHGYAVVLPVRPGHGRTGGNYLETQGGCAEADYVDSGLATADSIRAALDYMTAQPFIDKTGAVVVGQSAGAWGALALSSENPPGVRAVIDFAGGRGGHANGKPRENCAPDTLIAAARRFGATARIPTLWIYAGNDSYFAPDLSRHLADAYGGAGGNVEYHLLGNVHGEGHFLVQYPDAVALWGPIAEEFLARLSLQRQENAQLRRGRDEDAR